MYTLNMICTRHTSLLSSEIGMSAIGVPVGCIDSIFFDFSRGVFIPAQVINFGLVPHHMRVVFVGVVSLFWSKNDKSFLMKAYIKLDLQIPT